MYWVYILRNPQGRFYIGQTQSLESRLADHNRTDVHEGIIHSKEWAMGIGLEGRASRQSFREATGTPNQADEIGLLDS